jgi:hypothetical protein
MRRRVNPYIQFVVLSVCIAALLAATSFCLHRMTTAESKASEQVALRKQPRIQRLSTSKPATAKPSPSGYTVIAQRDLFQRLIAPKAIASSTSSLLKLSEPVSMPTFPTLPVAPSQMLSLAEMRNPILDKISVVGTVQVGNDWFALMEDVGKGETRTVRAGESAFGYTVKSVNADGAVLEREGKTFTVVLGENKAATPIRLQPGTLRTLNSTNSPPPAGGTPASMTLPVDSLNFSGNIPNLSNVSSEERQQTFEDWQRQGGLRNLEVKFAETSRLLQ